MGFACGFGCVLGFGCACACACACACECECLTCRSWGLSLVGCAHSADLCLVSFFKGCEGGLVFVFVCPMAGGWGVLRAVCGDVSCCYLLSD